MHIAQHIALVDELCFRPFPAEHGPSDVGASGPGYHVAVLESAADSDPAARAVTTDQFEKGRDAVYELLASRWGDTDPYNLHTVQLRAEREEVPRPWAELSAWAAVAYVWRVGGTGRWVALAVADRDPADDVRLLAVITETDPP
ncbi:hypothetical protein [Streptomyces djakartensis]|uniref:Uncharacterized protein n=1 Tax=Streptomyces djakartensis TaxID=68193 RepID=A0ABQ3A3G7_9ACTN|nr:hypothetical protein [Streptomyces djakartensis]GGY31468.1 hypothetical protein GCM10010384_43350 [Streptomyces djakartensis]